MINRLFTASLTRWSTAPERRPLVIRGARQVGKSYIVRSFAAANFEHLAEVNFEKNPELREIFEITDGPRICQLLSQVLNKPVEAGRTLLFLDEIQECAAAMLALRYLHEQLPQLHVIAAGSLLDFVLRNPPDSMRVPVGRIEYRYLAPVSFREFLEATGHSGLLAAIHQMTPSSPLPEILHQKALTLVGDYMQIGGMPAALSAYIQGPASNRYQELQAAIVQTYRDDFRKYHGRVEIDLLEAVFRRIPLFVTKKFKFSELFPDTQSRSLRRVIDLFEMARVVIKVIRSSANGVPLEAESEPDDYKFILCDVGLLGASLQAPRLNSERWNLELTNAGPITEQFVGQELVATQLDYLEPRLFYWAREEKYSQAEVDYVIAHNSTIIPIEVKAGTTGRLQSLRTFMEKKQSQLGVRISQQPLSLHDGVLSCPLYAIAELSRLLDAAIKQ